MARRVSLKGKGADLFFDDRPPGVADREQDVDGVTPDTAEPTSTGEDEASVHGELPATNNGVAAPDLTRHGVAEPMDRGGAEDPNTAEPEPSSDHGSVTAEFEPEFLDTMWERLISQATNSNSFRYTTPELDELNDALYQVSKEERVRLTKQDIARLGLNAVLWDYRQRGGDSWLRQFARRKRQPRER